MPDVLDEAYERFHGVIRVGHAVETLNGGDERPAAVAELAHGLAYWAARRSRRSMPATGVSVDVSDADPADVFARAAEHGDEHVIKFTDTAIDVYDRTGNPAALHAMELISPEGAS